MKDWFLKLLAVMSAGVVLLAPALPAAADVQRPTWYGSARKAFDRMGVTSEQLPWWMGETTAAQIVTLTGTALKINAKLADRLNGFPTQNDFDKAISAHDGRIAYEDVTVDMSVFLNALGETFADGYTGSVAGTLSYGQAGYIPTAEEIEAESLKLAHTSSYLLAQAQAYHPDSDAGAKASSCTALMQRVQSAVDYAWTDDTVTTPGKVLQAEYGNLERDPEFGDVIGYDAADFKKYDAMALLDRDGGSLYYDDIKKEVEKKSKSSKIDLGKVKTSDVTGRKSAKSIFAGIVKGGKGLLKDGVLSLGVDFIDSLVQGSAKSLIDMTYGTEAWCDSYAWAVGQDNMFLGVLGVLGKDATKAFAGLDCDNLEQRKKFLDDVQWVEAMKKLRGAEETHTDDKAPHWSWTWTPWYVATQDGTSVYIRGRHYQDGKGAHLVWTDTIRVTKSNKGHLLGHVLPGDNAPLYPNSFNPYYRNNNLDAGFTEVSQMIYGTDVNDYSSSSDITNIFPFGYWPGDPDTVMSHFRYFAGDYGYHGYGVDDAYKDGVAFSECGDDCPAAYQPTVKDQDVSVDVTSQSGDGTRTTVSGGGQSTGSSTGWAPGHIQTKLNDDGSVSGSVSIDANTKTGTVNLGSGGLDGIYPNAAGKRLDLIDVKTGKSCFLEGYACVDWVKEVQEIIPDHQLDVTTKVTTKEQPALSYKCSYDVPGKITEVPIGECIAYAPSFGEEAQRSGQTTGQPDGSTATDTTTAPAKDYDWSDCVKSGTQGNAAAWLYEPIVCAANILIVPRTKVLTTTRAKFARDTSNGILPQWRALQVNWAGLFDIDLGSCHGYRFSFGWNGIKIFDDAEVLNACPGQQLDFLPKISCAVITLLLCIVAVMICRKAFMAIFDYHPGGDGGEA
ncbi:hypothetical protein BMERY_0696 [Bifidobacterium merycicum]|uniref:Uncharacterized protein n=4 Tax=Bifidobacterium merycicum TaxID=78345 RepID=A0A087BGR7_9BIFI|nr:hypothetical protein [Bifidobacterium merycicum]KFI70217.1 hypothetical protein BMERY_0696 [Bifidobacterium merycicum]